MTLTLIAAALVLVFLYGFGSRAAEILGVRVDLSRSKRRVNPKMPSDPGPYDDNGYGGF